MPRNSPPATPPRSTLETLGTRLICQEPYSVNAGGMVYKAFQIIVFTASEPLGELENIFLKPWEPFGIFEIMVLTALEQSGALASTVFTASEPLGAFEETIFIAIQC